MKAEYTISMSIGSTGLSAERMQVAEMVCNCLTDETADDEEEVAVVVTSTGTNTNVTCSAGSEERN